MARRSRPLFLAAALSLLAGGCTTGPAARPAGRMLKPSAVIDLGAVVTEDLPQRFWGRAFLEQMGFTKPNAFEVVSWEFPVEGATIRGSNAYYTLFNHGGPHVDAPNHFGLGGGLESFPLESFTGPLRVFDVSGKPRGRSVPADVFRGSVEAGDVVLVFTRYVPPATKNALPEVVTVTHEAADFLAHLPVRAYGTDSFSVESLGDLGMPTIHHSFLSRGIPVYEQLLNVERLLGRRDMLFVGVPLNIKGGDGMIVRPVVFVYE